jgi:hypothetical protein
MSERGGGRRFESVRGLRGNPCKVATGLSRWETAVTRGHSRALAGVPSSRAIARRIRLVQAVSTTLTPSIPQAKRQFESARARRLRTELREMKRHGLLLALAERSYARSGGLRLRPTYWWCRTTITRTSTPSRTRRSHRSTGRRSSSPLRVGRPMTATGPHCGSTTRPACLSSPKA